MKFSEIRSSVVAQWLAPQGQVCVPFILSEPGLGKSSCARAIARDFLEAVGQPYEEYSTNLGNVETANVLEFNPSLREPVDVLGIPVNEDNWTRWHAPEEFACLRWRPEDTRYYVLIVEEASDATVAMQNAMCRVILDKHAGQLRLSDRLFIIMTGNRTEDKSGANRLTSKFAGRTRKINFTASVDDYCDYAIEQGISPVIPAYLRWKPESLVAFDPNRHANANPRSWERVNLIPTTLPTHIYAEHVIGEVGEGVGTEFVGFLRIYEGLPDLDKLLENPEKAEVPKDLAVLYAICGALARKATKDNFGKLVAYFERLPKEFNVMAVKDSMKVCKDVKHTRAFVEWAGRNSEVLMA